MSSLSTMCLFSTAKMALFTEEHDQPQPHDEEKRTRFNYGLTTDSPWWALSRQSSILSSFHGHGDLGVFVGSQIKLNYGQLWGEIVQSPAKHRKAPYPHVKSKNEYKL